MRHEAAEALGAIAAPDCLEVLQNHKSDSCHEVAETCQLALGRLAYLQQKQAAEAAAAADAAAAAGAGEEESPYYSVDPTPALPSSTPTEELRSILLDPQQPMFEVRHGHMGWQPSSSVQSQLAQHVAHVQQEAAVVQRHVMLGSSSISCLHLACLVSCGVLHSHPLSRRGMLY